MCGPGRNLHRCYYHPEALYSAVHLPQLALEARAGQTGNLDTRERPRCPGSMSAPRKKARAARNFGRRYPGSAGALTAPLPPLRSCAGAPRQAGAIGGRHSPGGTLRGEAACRR